MADVKADVKLGKLAKKVDSRTLQLRTILKALPPIPDSYDVDSTLTGSIPMPMFGNDQWGDCVMAGRAHMTLRFEDFEQRQILAISDSEVLNEYWKEQGAGKGCLLFRKKQHPDNGLVMLDSLNCWRKGWKAAGNIYDIYAFAEVGEATNQMVKAAIYLLSGSYAGVELPISAQNQDIWDVDNSPNGAPGSWGGHCVYIVAYDPYYVTCITWGQRKKMTWGFWDKYVSENYAIVDDRDKFVNNSPVDVNKLDAYLNQL